MNQKKANKIFRGELGKQTDILYSTSDGRCFIRQSEAILHSEGKLDEATKPLGDQTITPWYDEN